MVLTMFHSPVRFGAFAVVGVVGGSDLTGPVFVGLVSGVACEPCVVLPLVGEYHLFIPNRSATAPAPSIIARRIMTACKTQRNREREYGEDLEETAVHRIVGRDGDD